MVEEICEVLPSNASVIVVPEGGLQVVLPAALRSFCGVPAAWAPPDFAPEEWAATIESTRRSGRAPVLITRTIEQLDRIDPQSVILAELTVDNDRHVGGGIEPADEYHLWRFSTVVAEPF
jgi:hypothetical protein